MTDIPAILAFSGSTRRGSFNDLLVRVAARAAEQRGVAVNVIRLREFPMPLYDADLEAEHGLPDAARKFKRLMLSHQGFLVASPEYNSSISAVLKNAIDWASRREDAEAPLACFKSKVVGLLSASPGALGGLRGLVHIRAIFGNLGCLVIPEQMAVSAAHLAFDDQGRLKDDDIRERVEAVGAAVATLLKRLYSQD
ncbi:MAG: NAD(P)H-dependent oxidoreductase [Methylococcaceae bacterium]|nr:NAD(P)H-dependent oxidoreductase [Methylococcaceae bacterium]MCI0667598.1 NAD(P)H-dependent oxidoreductase [Methylococcaceae bacterium]MCI0734582.1 NAD(P)H-dependent oxidoreductase [Methylococcaceae bacterium]